LSLSSPVGSWSHVGLGSPGSPVVAGAHKPVRLIGPRPAVAQAPKQGKP